MHTIEFGNDVNLLERVKTCIKDEYLYRELLYFARFYPHRLFLLAGFNDVNLQDCYALLAAIIPFSEERYVSIEQAIWDFKKAPHYDRKWSEFALSELKNWALLNGIHRIYFETEKQSVVQRACLHYGFKPHSVILSMDI